MHNLMQDWPLRVSTLIDHAARYHADRPIITRSVEGPITRTTWGEVGLRARKAAQALQRLGVKPGDVVGCMAWNTSRHMEVWYGVPGAGAVLHTLNPRLFQDQLTYVITHAEDSVLIVDRDLLPIIEGVWDRLTGIRHVIVLTDRAHMPETTLDVLCYEELIAVEDGEFDWVEGDERDACGICYTSGTTGNP
ncbi:MAG: AMP-binding protein, partial [Pseudomonadota bacterium]